MHVSLLKVPRSPLIKTPVVGLLTRVSQMCLTKESVIAEHLLLSLGTLFHGTHFGKRWYAGFCSSKHFYIYFLT